MGVNNTRDRQKNILDVLYIVKKRSYILVVEIVFFLLDFIK